MLLNYDFADVITLNTSVSILLHFFSKGHTHGAVFLLLYVVKYFLFAELAFNKITWLEILYVICGPLFGNVCIDAFVWPRFTKTWRIQNIGDESWPLGCCLRFSGGDRLCAADRIPVEPVSPGCTIDLSVDMVSPEQPGIYESKWRMSTFSGSYFGGLFFSDT